MYIVACARCQTRLTEKVFTSYAAAAKAGHELGFPAGDGDELWCGACMSAHNGKVGTGIEQSLTRHTA